MMQLWRGAPLLLPLLFAAGCGDEATGIPPTEPDVAVDAGGDAGGTDTVNSDVLDAGALPDVALDIGAPDVMPDVAPDTSEDVLADAVTPDVDGGPQMNACLVAADGPDYQVSAKAVLRWKRGGALERDLLSALVLDPATACSEVGIPGICFNIVHLVPLGGNDPVGAAMYQPIDRPGVTSAIAIERVILAACGARVDLDTQAWATGETAAVFQALDLQLDVVGPDSEGIKAVVVTLFRRFHARDPSPEELAMVADLTAPVDGVAPTAREWAKMACFAVASTTEFLFH